MALGRGANFYRGTFFKYGKTFEKQIKNKENTKKYFKHKEIVKTTCFAKGKPPNAGAPWATPRVPGSLGGYVNKKNIDFLQNSILDKNPKKFHEIFLKF